MNPDSRAENIPEVVASTPTVPSVQPPQKTKNFLKGFLLVILTPIVFKIVISLVFLVRFWIDSQRISLPSFLYDFIAAVVTSVIVYLLAKLIKLGKAKIFSLIIFIILIILLAFLDFFYRGSSNFPQDEVSKSTSANTTPTKNELKAEELIFDDKGLLYLFNTQTQQKTLLPIEGLKEKLKELENPNYPPTPKHLTFSPRRDKLYFNLGQYLFVYDFSSQKTKILELDYNANFRTLDSFSPNGNYAVVDTGGSPGNRGRTLITVDGEILDQAGGQGIAWSPDSKKYALSDGDVRLGLPSGEGMETQSVYLKEITGKNVITKKLLNADYQTSYLIDSWQNNETIIVQKLVYEKAFPSNASFEQTNNNRPLNDYWRNIFDNPSKSYISYDITDNSIKTIESPKQSPKESGNQSTYDPNISPEKQWKIEIDHYPNKDRMSVWQMPFIYISGINGENKVKIGEGTEAIWKPSTSIHTSPTPSASTTFIPKDKNDLVGIWQSNSVMAAGWGNKFHFFESGKYSFTISSMCGTCREIGDDGYWEFKDSKITFNEISQATLVGGKEIKDPVAGTILVDTKTETKTFNPPKTSGIAIKPCQKIEVDLYNCLNIGGIDYYKFGDDPSIYGYEKFAEPNF